MIDPVYSLQSLFDQLGLDSTQEGIDAFVKTHQLKDGEALHEAAFFTPSQANFLRESITNDAAWSEVVDELNLLLHG